MSMSGGLHPDHPRTAGPWVPLAAVPISRWPTKGWLRERCRVLPQCPGSHSAPSSPYEDIIRGLCLEPLHQKARRPDNWCQSVDPPGMSIFTPRAMQVALGQDPATLCSTVTSPQQLDQGPIIRKLSRDGNEEQIVDYDRSSDEFKQTTSKPRLTENICVLASISSQSEPEIPKSNSDWSIGNPQP